MMIVHFLILPGIPLAILAIAIYVLSNSVVPVKRQLPEDLPHDLFATRPPNKPALEEDEVATRVFKQSFLARTRRRLVTMYYVTSQYFFIQKRH